MSDDLDLEASITLEDEAVLDKVASAAVVVGDTTRWDGDASLGGRAETESGRAGALKSLTVVSTDSGAISGEVVTCVSKSAFGSSSLES